jgi:DNA-binding MarR family transcriptional regulator
MSDQRDITPLIRAVYELTALKRDLSRIAAFDHPVGLVPLAVVHRCAPARVRDVADELHVDLSVASRQLAALEAAGYLRRDPDPDDRRSQRVSLTPVGEAALERAHENIVGVFGEILAAWSDEEITSLAGALNRLRADYERVTTSSPHSLTTKEAA